MFSVFPAFAGDDVSADVVETDDSQEITPSGTLPVLHINTENGTPVDQREVYIPGEYWFDADGFEGYKSSGTEDSPLALEIRGRGNSTWTLFDKKPYKIKLGKKAVLIDGTEKNKHYALLHNIGTLPAYFSHALGFEIGLHLVKGWTPSIMPVEVVLNGQYIGIYFLTESVRIDKGRVDIEEQPEGNTDLETIDGGYLVEIDNYFDENQLVLQETPTVQLLLTVKTPNP